MPITDNLIFDRTQEDVDRVKELMKIGFDNMSSEEQLEYLSPMKGSYNVSDLERVQDACEYVANRLNSLGYSVSIDTVYQPNSLNNGTIPTQEKMDKYIQNIHNIRSKLSVIAPLAPSDMQGLTYEEANNIEKILYEVDKLIDRIIQSFVYSGQVNSGIIWEEFTHG